MRVNVSRAHVCIFVGVGFDVSIYVHMRGCICTRVSVCVGTCSCVLVLGCVCMHICRCVCGCDDMWRYHGKRVRIDDMSTY